MNKILDFCKSNKYALIWTFFYALVMWAVLLGMFNFNMFSTENWVRLAHAELRGFAGFVFGIMILAAIPLYVATTAIIVRTKAPLFKIPIPKFLAKLYPAPTPPEPDDADVPTPDDADVAPTVPPLPAGLPAELRGAYIRARQHTGTAQISAFDLSRMSDNAPVATMQPELQPAAQSEFQSDADLPLPTDFNFDDGDATFAATDAPVFTDINFDAPSSPVVESPAAPNDTLTTPDTNNTAPPAPAANITVEEYLKSHGYEITAIEKDIIITKDFAIATHDDPDFWIADLEDWFAAGKQKSSPAEAVTATAGAHGVRPVLYLAQTNIMDLDARKAQWESQGITVITDLSQLPE